MASELHEARAPRRKPPKKLRHLEVKKAKNGGHVVTHHFEHYEHPPEEHVFGEGQGDEMLAHVADHMGVAPPEEDEQPEEEEQGDTEQPVGETHARELDEGT